MSKHRATHSVNGIPMFEVEVGIFKTSKGDLVSGANLVGRSVTFDSRSKGGLIEVSDSDRSMAKKILQHQRGEAVK